MGRKKKKATVSRKEFINLSGIISASVFLIKPEDFFLQHGAGTFIPVEYQYSNEVIEKFETQKNLLILTIDDGWYYNSIEEMLEIMKEKNVKATLFLVGHVLKNPIIAELTRQAGETGHEIAYHSMTHSEMAITEEMTKEEWLIDFEEWITLIKEVLGPKLFEKSVANYARAPGGAFTHGFMQMCLEKKLMAMGWSAGPQTINRKFKPKKGDIYLGHFRQQDIDLLKRVVNGEFGLKPVSIGEYFELELPKHRSDGNKRNLDDKYWNMNEIS